MSTKALGQLSSREQAMWFHDRLVGMDPFRFNGIEPGALRGQEAGQNTNAFAGLFDLVVVFTDPGANHLADMPASMVPDQEPVVLALGSQALTTLLQTLNADGTHGPSGDKAQPDLPTIRLVERSRLPQDAIAGQRLGVGIILEPGLCDEVNWVVFAVPGLHERLGKAAPPHFVQKADGPLGMLAGISEQAVTSFF